jgi:hypothetical protein
MLGGGEGDSKDLEGRSDFRGSVSVMVNAQPPQLPSKQQHKVVAFQESLQPFVSADTTKIRIRISRFQDHTGDMVDVGALLVQKIA